MCLEVLAGRKKVNGTTGPRDSRTSSYGNSRGMNRCAPALSEELLLPFRLT
jgi:hypothetical protein